MSKHPFVGEFRDAGSFVIGPTSGHHFPAQGVLVVAKHVWRKRDGRRGFYMTQTTLTRNVAGELERSVDAWFEWGDNLD